MEKGKNTKIPHERSPHHRTAIIDNATAVYLRDNIGERLAVSLTRFEVISVSEPAVEFSDGRVQPVMGSTPAVRHQRTLEFTADMRPDQALLVVNQIIETLRVMPPERKARYGIPVNIAQIAVAPVE